MAPSLTPEDSLQYIHAGPAFRAIVDEQEGGLVRLNLGDQFGNYMNNAEFRGRVLDVVGENRGRVWSDVEWLEIEVREENEGEDEEEHEPIVVDFNDLAGLINLIRLKINRAQLVNFAAVGALTNLRDFELISVDGVHDISVLNGLVNLQMLDLIDTQVHGIDQLGGLERLNYLGLSSTGIIDMNDLAVLTTLRALIVSGCQVVNFAAVGALTNLERFVLASVDGVHDVSVLNGLVNLQDLDIYQTQVHGINQLGGLQRLRRLRLIRSGVTDMNNLIGLNHLAELSFEAAYLQNVHALAQLPRLRDLSIWVTNGALDMAGIAGCVNLVALNIRAPNVLNVHARALLVNLRPAALRMNGAWRNNNPIVPPPAQVQPVVPPHAQIPTVLPENADYQICFLCVGPIANLAQCLRFCSPNEICHRACFERWNGPCPFCRAPLGLLP